MAAPWLAGAVQAGAGLGGTGISAWSNANQNRKNRQFAKDQYWQELQDQYSFQGWRDSREDSVWNRQNEYDQRMWGMQNKYNEERWNIQNQYDSPAAQMQRFREAGLNPHLIYGQMGNGGSIATAQMDTTATGHSSSSTPHASYQGRPADWSSLSSGIMGIWDAYQKNVQTDNLKTANELAKEEIALRQQEQIKKAAEIGNILANTATSEYNLDWQKSIRGLSLEALKESLRGRKVETDIALSRLELEKASQYMSVKKAAEEILNLRGVRVTNQMEQELKRMEIENQKAGINPGTPAWLRALQFQIKKYSETPKTMLSDWED